MTTAEIVLGLIVCTPIALWWDAKVCQWLARREARKGREDRG